MRPLSKAAESGHTEVVKLLLTLNPPPDVNLASVSIPTMMSVHLMGISPLSCIHTTHSFLPLSACIVILRLDVPPSTAQQDIQYHSFCRRFPLSLIPILPSLRFSYVSLLLGYPSTHTYHLYPTTHSYIYSSLSYTHTSINIPTHIIRPHILSLLFSPPLIH